jgi:hypothetical protein
MRLWMNHHEIKNVFHPISYVLLNIWSQAAFDELWRLSSTPIWWFPTCPVLRYIVTNFKFIYCFNHFVFESMREYLQERERAEFDMISSNMFSCSVEALCHQPIQIPHHRQVRQEIIERFYFLHENLLHISIHILSLDFWFVLTWIPFVRCQFSLVANTCIRLGDWWSKIASSPPISSHHYMICDNFEWVILNL